MSDAELCAEWRFNPGVGYAGNPNVFMRIYELDKYGEELDIADGMQFLCDDCPPDDSCELETPTGLADYLLNELGYELAGEWPRWSSFVPNEHWARIKKL